MKKCLLFVCVGVVCLGVLLTGLAIYSGRNAGNEALENTEEDAVAEDTANDAVVEDAAEDTVVEDTEDDTVMEDAAEDDSAENVYTLYIGRNEAFLEYSFVYEGELNELGMIPVEVLFSEMAKLTGWNLDLADEITSGRGGVTVSFADTCSLFTGPPEEQKEEFFVYDNLDLADLLLESVKRTLQYHFVNPELGDPLSLDVYFCGPDGGDIFLPGIGVSIPSDVPYEGLESLT